MFSPAVSTIDGAKIEPSDLTNSGIGSANNEAPKLESAVQGATSTVISTSSAVISSSTMGTILRSLKRPVLPSKDYETLLAEENVGQPSNTLYDYTTLEAW